MWAGPAVTYPIEMGSLTKEISFDQGSYICKDKDDSLAFGQVFKNKDGYSHMTRIIANPRFRGLGYGRSICNALVDYASKFGDLGVSLNVYRNNLPALKLYRSMGFIEEKEKSTSEKVFMVRT